MVHLGKRAIVIGASMSGLLAARVLADYYDEVTVLERDSLGNADAPRKGVPQGRHAHGLLARGREVLEQLFPGLTEEVVAQGAVACDLANEVLWFNYGCYLDTQPMGMRALGISRPALEGHVRRRLLQHANVRLQDESEAVEPVFDRAEGRVTGIRVRRPNGAEDGDALSADLIVDAGGRGARTPAWLEALGYDKPPEERIPVNITYMTRYFRRRPEQLHGKACAIMGACHPDWRFGALIAQEGDRWVVSLGGYLGDQSPADEAGFIAFARSLQKPEIFDVIKDAEPLSPLTSYRFDANLRRRYEALSRFPDGFVVVGDALCSFNPAYGQGMSVACVEALALRDCLEAGAAGLARRFFRSAGRLIDIPWQIAVGADLQHPRVQGERTTKVRFINWYIAKFYQAAQRDPVLTARFLEVANLMRQPPSLLDPRMAVRVWRGRALTHALVAPASDSTWSPMNQSY
jgi:2-polyprenyl-6-methoxyphenol hydroxylase-like FAD-dependent oxidoreductase